jgi:DNA-binding SARP family transcriptional activator/tetratricopeptide (TPR) repeat protein
MEMGAQLRFSILGPLTAAADGERLKISSARQRTILALLVLFPNQVVSVDTMVESIWPDRAPVTARTQISICVAALRRLFASVGAAEELIVTEYPGYRLNSERHEIDWVLFDEAVESARRAARGGRPAEAGRGYGRALGLWRGRALSGITGMVADTEAARLDERRLAVNDEALGVLLDLGEHSRVLPEAAAVVKENPLREHTVGLLMLAQYRSGRRAEALETFRRTRQLFVTELGVDPGPELLKLQGAILRDDPSLAPAHPPEAVTGEAAAVTPPGVAQRPADLMVPSELPPNPHGFVGRGAELAALDLLCVPPEDGYGPSIGLITGVAGVGKTSLAVHWAHQVTDRYPDGRLFADLRGFDERHDLVPTAEVLSQFLRSLGVPGARIPTSVTERTAMYRSILNERKVLVLLDNTRSFEQVRPLLPSSPGCTALITGREQLQSLMVSPPQARIHLGVLPHAEALELLGAIIGAPRIEEAPRDADRIVEFCDCLPLAVRVAGARLATKPHWTLRRLADRLSDEGSRLDELSQGDARVRASFELSYRHLDPDAVRMYQALSLLDVPDFAAWVGAALLDIPLAAGERLIEQFVDTQLLEVAGVDRTGSLRYRFQKLLLLYARERALEGDPDEHRDAVDRVLRSYLGLALQAHLREYGGYYTVLRHEAPKLDPDEDLAEDLLGEPLEWFEAERTALMSVVRQAAQSGRGELAWNLTMSMVSLFEVRDYIDNWLDCCEVALAAAVAEGDVLGQACMLHDIGAVALRRRYLVSAEDFFDRALEHYARIGEEHGRAMTLRSLAIVDRLQGRLDRAGERLAGALPVFRAIGDLSSEAHTLNNLAQTALDRRAPEEALELALEAVRVSERIGRGGERSMAQSVHRVARAQLALKRIPEAADSFRQVIRIVKAKSDLVGLAYATFGLGETHLSADEADAALVTMSEALTVVRQIDSPLLEGQITLAMARIECRRGQTEQAAIWLESARELFERTGSAFWRHAVAEERERWDRPET